jgi:ribosomal protein S18 acetylase RimI-like enzyme
MLATEENVQTLIDAWKLMTGRFAGSGFEGAEGVASTFANIALPFMNISFQDRPTTNGQELRSLLQTMRQRAKTCPHPSMIALSEEWTPEGWAAAAAEEGFHFALNMTGMAAETLLPLRRPSPNLEYRRVQDVATATDLATINAQAYGMPTEMWDCVCNMQLWHPDSYAFVGYVDGKAVTAAASLPIDGAMYIALVATLPEAHGKGYAEAVMRQAIQQAQAGMGKRRMILHASEMGQPLYTSMGFHAGGKIALFSAG